MSGRADEETGLLNGASKTSTGPSMIKQVGGAILIGAISFALGMMVPKQESSVNNAARSGMPVDLPVNLSTNSKYTKFQAHNFQLYTGGAALELDDNSTNPECRDLNYYGAMGGDMYCYMGHLNTTRDVEDRLSIMYEAVERAHELSDKSADTLKVFVAPEFFFRGRNGAYLMDHDQHSHKVHTALFDDEDGKCLSEVCQILVGLEQLVMHKRFQDWIFLFGTSVVSETLPKEDQWDYLFYNYGMLYKGYDPAKMSAKGKRFLIPKRYVSNMDFLTPYRELKQENTEEVYQYSSPYDTTVLNPHDLEHKKYDRNLWHNYKNEIAEVGYTMIEYGWFMMDGITFTVEICLDHDMKTALTAYLADYATPEKATLVPSVGDEQIDYVEIPKHQAQLSLVCSAGMSVSQNALALVDGGSIILQDGMYDGPPVMNWTHECFKYQWMFDGGSEVVSRKATLTPTEVVFHYKVNDGYTKYSIYKENWGKKLRGVFTAAEYEPMIVVHDTVPLATV